MLYQGIHCGLAIERLAEGLVVIKLSGYDAGELGDIPMQELGKDIAGEMLVELFIDAREVKGASLEVSSAWSQWLGLHRDRFEHISMLTGSPFIQLTAHFVRQYADLGEVMRIYTDPAAFDRAVSDSIARRPRR